MHPVKKSPIITYIHANLVFSGVYLVFEVFQDTWRSNNNNPGAYWNAALSCPFMASNYANSHLVPISF